MPPGPRLGMSSAEWSPAVLCQPPASLPGQAAAVLWEAEFSPTAPHQNPPYMTP